ncbi:response regulator transcription factor [Anaerobacillus sp. CMMVII]|nr:response regulator transcription factor [Anaerobacillus sp. CMMVII]
MKIVIADDHHVVRKGLVFFLKTQEDLVIVGEAQNGLEAIKLADELLPDIILMDVMMPEMDGIEATKRIKETHPEMKILILTSMSDQGYVIPAIRAGANGYQLKDVEPDELVRSIRGVANGESQLSAKVTSQMMTFISGESKGTEKPLSHLTKREKDVLAEIAKGKSNKEIAVSLFITEKTVKTHVSNILAKLELHDRTQAALYAVKHGL